MLVAVTPKTSTSKAAPRQAAKPAAKAKTSPAMLSASEALKAAEAAIAPAPVKKAVGRPPKAKTVPVATPAVAKSAPVPEPVAVVAATTMVDAAPEPEQAPEPMVKASKIEAPVTKITPEPITLPKAKPTPPAAAPAIEGNMMMNDVIETGKKFAEDAKVKLETAFAGLNEKAKVGVEKSTKALEEISDLAKGNVEALVESGKIAAKGIETFGQEAVDYSRKNFEKATASMKSFSTIKTPTEFFQLQSQLFSSSFDEFTKEAAKSSEAFMKLAGDVAGPITARVTVVTDKVKSLAA
jgi:hypothetical protein